MEILLWIILVPLAVLTLPFWLELIAITILLIVRIVDALWQWLQSGGSKHG